MVGRKEDNVLRSQASILDGSLCLLLMGSFFFLGQPGIAQSEFMPSQSTSQQSASPTGSNLTMAASPEVSNSGTDVKLIATWFNKYDNIRRKSQMDAKSRAKANALLSKGLAIIVPGDDRNATQKLLNELITRYSVAIEALKLLPLYPETEKLHRGYYEYFNQARGLFSDYLAVQNNLLVTDAQGNPVAKSLMPRKQSLEMLDQNNKSYDAYLRQKFGIKAYDPGASK